MLHEETVRIELAGRVAVVLLDCELRKAASFSSLFDSSEHRVERLKGIPDLAFSFADDMLAYAAKNPPAP